jgi:hypothetical protein
MKSIKVNWGAGIAALYGGFVIMIATLVVMSTRQKIDLVTDHYYEEELKFQDKISKIGRANALEKPLHWKITAQNLEILYPTSTDGKLSGTIKLYCPANDRNDREFAVNATGGMQIIPLAQVPAGRYKVQIDWQADGTSYWNEGVARINEADL